MAINFWNSIFPLKTNLPASNSTSYGMPPLHDPLPNHILPPGFTPNLPTPAIPGPTLDVKALINSLPSLFNLNHG